MFIGKGNYDKDKITGDVKQVVHYLVSMMGGPPYKKYVFFLRARPGTTSGGLEHFELDRYVLLSVGDTFDASDLQADSCSSLRMSSFICGT